MNLGGPSDIDPTDMTEVLAAIEASPETSMSELDGFSAQQSAEVQLKLMEEERDTAIEAARQNYEALKELVNICKRRGFDPFEGESAPLSKPLALLTREELIARNEEVTQRINYNRRATSNDKIPMPTPQEQIDMYKKQLEENQSSPMIQLILSAMEAQKKGVEAPRTTAEPTVTYDEIPSALAYAASAKGEEPKRWWQFWK
jgi:hypothetical protein